MRTQRFGLFRIVVVAGGLLMVGCGGGAPAVNKGATQDSKTPVPLAGEHKKLTKDKVMKPHEVPPNVMEVAKKTLPDVEFEIAWQNIREDKTLDSYEIKGKDSNGKTREVRVSPAGKVLEVE